MKECQIKTRGKSIVVDYRDCDGRAHSFKLGHEDAKELATVMLMVVNGEAYKTHSWFKGE